jgi:hypothetical protein
VVQEAIDVWADVHVSGCNASDHVSAGVVRRIEENLGMSERLYAK